MAQGQSQRPTPNARLGSLQGFLPLSPDDLASTRGQKLPSLLQDRSSAKQKDVRAQPQQRRLASYVGSATGGRDRGSDYGRGVEKEGDMHTSVSSCVPTASDRATRNTSNASEILMTPQLRSQRLIGSNNSRYQWQQYYKNEDELKKMNKPIREYYQTQNNLICSFLYIDRLVGNVL